MKKILFIATGGTISCGETENGLSPSLDSKQLLSCLPQLKELCEIKSTQPFSLDSTNMSPSQWKELAAIIRGNYAQYDGFVITHGTDTLGYCAAALSCLVQGSGKPIILTGSQLPMEAEGTDAKRNLYDAFRCACDDRLRGVFAVFCGRIIRGEQVRKVHTRKLDGFRGFMTEQEGSVSAEKILPPKQGKPAHSPVFYDRMDTRVCVMKLVPGMSAELLRAVGEHCRAVVIEGFGLGGVPDYFGGEFSREISAMLARDVRVIMTTQVHEGGCDLSVYEVGTRTAKLGVLEARGMTTEYACMKAMWALAYSNDREEFKRLFTAEI